MASGEHKVRDVCLKWHSSAIIGIIGGLFVFYSLFAPSPLRYPNEPFPVINPKVGQNEYVLTFVSRCNDTDHVLKYRIDRALVSVDGQFRTNLISNVVSLAPGCHNLVTRVSQIPPGTPPGMYVLEGMSTVETLLRTHKQHWFSMPFEVTP